MFLYSMCAPAEVYALDYFLLDLYSFHALALALREERDEFRIFARDLWVDS